MKAAIAIFIIGAVVFLSWKLFEFYDQTTNEREARAREEERQRNLPRRLTGMDPALDNIYRDAQQKGAPGLRDFLERYRGTQYLRDPKLAWIELDYVMLLVVSNPAEAKRLFNSIRTRVGADSPVYPRIRDLEKNF